ncbi:hypothetical protein QQZ08_004065 [Neonectria magnoliae]|uniref:Uncharacterized protein n=1 Tax=Neonectria magnoliae TaxID=2732573 RepID=A0ABR1I790_9HYPO
MLFSVSLLACLASIGSGSLIPSVRVVAQLGPGGFLENIAVRSNSDILGTTLVPNASVYSLTKPASKHRSFELLTTIPSIQSLLGITELNALGKEIFVVVGGNISSFDNVNPPVYETGSFSAWAVAFGGNDVRVSKISQLSPTSEFLNGVTAVPWCVNTVLIADSKLGTVGLLDTSTGAFEASAFAFPEMAPPPGAVFGVNGVKVSKSHLYWTNSGLLAVYRVPLTPKGYPVPGANPELVAANVSKTYVDDFAIAANNGIFGATNVDNSLVYIDPLRWKSNTVVGVSNYPAIAGVTAVAFGRGFADCNTLYAVTASSKVNNQTQNARIVAVEF